MDADVFLREARWANETYHLAQLDADNPTQLQAYFRNAHLARLQREYGIRFHPAWLPRRQDVTARQLDRFLRDNANPRLDNQGKVCLLLAAGPLAPLGQVYQVVFERVLNEKISTDPVAVVRGQ